MLAGISVDELREYLRDEVERRRELLNGKSESTVKAVRA